MYAVIISPRSVVERVNEVNPLPSPIGSEVKTIKVSAIAFARVVANLI